MTQNTKLSTPTIERKVLNLHARGSSTKWVFSLTGSFLCCCLTVKGWARSKGSPPPFVSSPYPGHGVSSHSCNSKDCIIHFNQLKPDHHCSRHAISPNTLNKSLKTLQQLGGPPSCLPQKATGHAPWCSGQCQHPGQRSSASSSGEAEW